MATSQNRAEEAIRRVQELDPTWRPTPSQSEGIEGQIARNIGEARQAEARLAEVLRRGFGSYESYAQFGQGLRQGFEGAGYTDTVPMIRGSAVTGQRYSTGETFDAGSRSDYDLAIVSPTLMQRASELGIGFRQGGTRTGPLTERQIESLGLTDVWISANRAAGRDVSFMIYGSVPAVTQRGPSRNISSR